MTSSGNISLQSTNYTKVKPNPVFMEYLSKIGSFIKLCDTAYVHGGGLTICESAVKAQGS